MEAMNIRPTGIYVDATFGRGGHAAAILQRLGVQGRLVAMDRDPAAVQVAVERFGGDSRFDIEQGSFAGLKAVVASHGLLGRVDGVLLDLGVSSPQLDDARRGFSFRHDGPLDMRMDPGTGISAAEWLAHAGESEITTVLQEFGEERYAIVAARKQAPIETTAQLAAIVAAANPAWEKGKDPATRSFQALRIYINRELEQLQACLDDVIEILAVGGRLVVISFHSLEDRMVKRFIRHGSQGEDVPRGLPLTARQQSIRLRSLGRAQRASAREVKANPRARSAVMRVAEKLQ